MGLFRKKKKVENAPVCKKTNNEVKETKVEVKETKPEVKQTNTEVKETTIKVKEEKTDNSTAKDSLKRKTRYHIAKRKEDGRWQVKREGAEKAIKLFNTQAEAITYADGLSKNQETSYIIHMVDGSIRTKNYAKKKD